MRVWKKKHVGDSIYVGYGDRLFFFFPFFSWIRSIVAESTFCLSSRSVRVPAAYIWLLFSSGRIFILVLFGYQSCLENIFFIIIIIITITGRLITFLAAAKNQSYMYKALFKYLLFTIRSYVACISKSVLRRLYQTVAALGFSFSC